MSSSIDSLLRSTKPELDKAIITLNLIGDGDGLSAAEIARLFEGAGGAKVNASRLKSKLQADRRVVRNGERFRVAPRYASEVAKMAAEFGGPQRPPDTSAAIDSGLFLNAPSYVKNVVEQINISYSNGCFDCSAVMVRRLFETMIVDAFEKQGAVGEIQSDKGDFLQLSGLISRLSSTRAFTTSRQTREAAPHLKDVGDWSAHNRRHRARRSDIEAAARHLRLAASDLLHLSGQD